MFISITGHGGIIGGILRAIGHRAAVVETGSLLPVVVSRLFPSLSGARHGVGVEGEVEMIG